ncbi:fumarylacetoacetase [Fusarium denticulatum]|uniref:Fumarylacetoacetase n=1 Tax=Fusarium denticulatum TaxID=48507 RepID=A0A8H5TGR6_9HYPO|nr:fumarylacetoacetase [Fusarium denticulatum]
MSSWLPVPQDSHFPIANLPFGIISTTSNPNPRPAVAIGDYAIDLQAFASAGGFESVPEIQLHLSAFSATSLNKFAALGRPFHRLVRKHLQRILRSDTDIPSLLRDDKARRDLVVIPRSEAINHLPLEIGDYTDFYAGKNHAYNVGVLFRGEENALQPNYSHIPIAYHGRASSVVLSGTSIRRPWGQVLKDGTPAFQPCEKLDFELEMGIFICRENHLGEPIPISMAEDYIFGYVLLNDWSARDIQAWEYVPLGPFTSKNLGTSISPWVVLADTLEQARQPGLPMTNPIFPYLEDDEGATIPIVELEVEIHSK